MERARLILNPASWGRRPWSTLPEIINLLEEVGIRADLTFTKKSETITESVRQAVEEGYRVVIAGGGDGTVSEVATGLVGTPVALGILPLGTFNNIAHSLHLPLDAAQAALCIAKGHTIDIDVCDANGVYAFEAVGIGLDATLFPIGEEIKGGHYEKLLGGAVRFLRHRTAPLTITLDGIPIHLDSPMVVVANGPYYGAGFTVAPRASLTDGILDVVTFQCTKVEIARQFALSARNKPHEEVCVYARRAEVVVVESSLALPAHADGKPLGTTPITCKVIARGLKVIVPHPLPSGEDFGAN